MHNPPDTPVPTRTLPPGGDDDATWIGVDGALARSDSPALRADDRIVLCGLGAFETVGWRGRPIRWDAHQERLRATLGALQLPTPEGLAQVPDLAQRLASLNAVSDGALRVTVTGGPAPLADQAPAPQLLVSLTPLDPRRLNRRHGLDLHTRWAPRPLPALKTPNWLEAWRACLDLPASGEPLLVNGDGEALEGATTNLFAWFEGALHTPPADGRLLPGVTRAAVLTLARSRGIAVWERPLRAADLSAAEEVWCTSALLPVARARSLDGTPLGCAGRLTSAWLAALEEVTP